MFLWSLDEDESLLLEDDFLCSDESKRILLSLLLMASDEAPSGFLILGMRPNFGNSEEPSFFFTSVEDDDDPVEVSVLANLALGASSLISLFRRFLSLSDL